MRRFLYHNCKTHFALILFIILASFAGGQTFLQEDFSSLQMPPEGWTIEGAPEQWSVNSSNNAGGEEPEASFTWIKLIDTSRLISPIIDLSEIQQVTLQFRHMYDLYQYPGPAIGVATRTGGSAWVSIWELNPAGNIGPELITLEVLNENFDNQEFQLCFYLKGDFWNIDNWFIDDILLFLPIKLNLTLFLEGPFDTDHMKNDLNISGLIPTHQPYYQFPWDYYGTESVASIPNNTVDWVLVKLIKIDSYNPLTTTSLAKQAALLSSNGTITGLNGSDLLFFSPLEEDSIHIMVHHRNHIAAISGNSLVSFNGIYNYDFTGNSDVSYLEEHATKELSNDTWGTISGDGNQDGQVDNRDKNEVWVSQNNNSYGYYSGDFNMDGNVDAEDLYARWKSNVGKGNRKTDSVAVPFVCGNQLFDERNDEYYETVQIGSQCWMAENLNYETGSSWCYYNSQASCDTLGRLYNWNTIMNGEPASNSVPSGVRGICPPGWHLPSDAEWCILTKYIDPTTGCNLTGYNGTDAGTKMKSKTGWSSGGNGTNESGFNAQASGSMGIYHFDDLHLYSYTWSCTEDYPGYAWYRKLSYGLPSVGRFFIAKSRGCSVRCVRD